MQKNYNSIPMHRIESYIGHARPGRWIVECDEYITFYYIGQLDGSMHFYGVDADNARCELDRLQGELSK